MISIYTNLTQTKIQENIVTSIFETNNTKQNIIVKGKLGQSQMVWSSSMNSSVKWNIGNSNDHHFHFFFDKKEKNQVMDLKYKSNNNYSYKKWPKPMKNIQDIFYLSLWSLNKDKNLYLNKGLSFLKEFSSCVKGISQGYTINLKLNGMGFNANYLSFDQIYSNNKDQDLNYRFKNLDESKKSKDNLKFVKQVLSFYLGKSHNLLYEIPLDSITISKDILKTTGIISIFSINLNYVSQIAAYIKNYKKPDPYKGKGISFENFTFVSKKEQKK